MQDKLNFQKVKELIAQDSQGKRDFLTPVNNLHALEDGTITFRDTTMVQGEGTKDIPFDTTNWAENQILTRLGMPAAYFQKAKQADPELYVRHFNYWAPRAEGVTRLRTKITGSPVGLIRGSVSEKYAPMDNEQAINEILAQILQGRDDDYEVNLFHLDDHRMHLRLTYLDLTKSIGTLPDGTPDYLRIGEDVTNSEVGAGSFGLNEMIWRLICSNGLVRWENSGNSFMQRHIHLRPVEFQARVAEAMVNHLNTGQEFLQQVVATQLQQVQNPFAVISKLSKQGGFSRGFTDTAKEVFEGDSTALGVINAFTRAARDLSNERRIEAERFAGKLVDFKPHQWERLDALEEEEVTA